jgi:hypothetical protein
MRAAAVADRDRAVAEAQADAERMMDQRVEAAIRERSAELEQAVARARELGEVLRDARLRWEALSAEITARLETLERDVAARLDQGAE